jgi:hypothetical protein
MLVKGSISIDSFSLYLTKKTSSLLQGKHRLLVAKKAAKIDILIGFLFDSAFPGKPFKSVGGTIYLDNWVFFCHMRVYQYCLLSAIERKGPKVGFWLHPKKCLVLFFEKKEFNSLLVFSSRRRGPSCESLKSTK